MGLDFETKMAHVQEHEKMEEEKGILEKMQMFSFYNSKFN